MAKRKPNPKQGELFEKPRVHRRQRDTLSGRKVRRELTTADCAAALGPLERGVDLYCLTMGKFSLIDVVEHVLEATGPADVVVSTWTAAGADIGFANGLLTDGRIKSLRFLVDFSFPSRQPAYCAALREAFGDDSIRVTKNHAKFVLVTNGEWRVVIRTSMNLNECRRLETVEISDDAELAGFLLEVVDALFAKQTAAEAFARTPWETCEAFGAEWGDGEAGGEFGAGDKRFFGDGVADVDLRRVGIDRRC